MEDGVSLQVAWLWMLLLMMMMMMLLLLLLLFMLPLMQLARRVLSPPLLFT